ncbi:MAG: hypothetical protein ABI947_03730 [Chloroflexota bacterium]
MSPWHILRKISTAAPHDRPALWSDGVQTLLAWPGEPSAPGIRLDSPDWQTPVKILPLGRIPREVSLFAGLDGNLNLLWLDQTLPDQAQLVGALIATNGVVKRSPGVISNRAISHYTAISTKAGDVIALWVESGEKQGVFIQLIDGQGRPRQAVQLAKAGSNPAAAFDLNGDLHIAWLESTAAHLWTIRYLLLQHGELPIEDNVPSIPVGVIRTAEPQTLGDFALGADATHVYCLWNIIQVGQRTAETPESSMAGLSFPISDNSAVRTLSFNSVAKIGLRDPDVPSAALPVLTIGITVSTWNGQRWQDVPATLSISPDGANLLQPVYAARSEPVVVGKVALSADSGGRLTLGWTELGGNGIATVYYATTR